MGCRPIERWDADQAATLELLLLLVVGWRSTTRLPRDHYVRLDSNDCGAPERGRSPVEIVADLEHVTVTCDGRTVAKHERCCADHQTITDPGHAAAAAELRQARRLIAVRPVDTTVEHRALTDYDHLFGPDSLNNEESA